MQKAVSFRPRGTCRPSESRKRPPVVRQLVDRPVASRQTARPCYVELPALLHVLLKDVSEKKKLLKKYIYIYTYMSAALLSLCHNSLLYWFSKMGFSKNMWKLAFLCIQAISIKTCPFLRMWKLTFELLSCLAVAIFKQIHSNLETRKRQLPGSFKGKLQ